MSLVLRRSLRKHDQLLSRYLDNYHKQLHIITRLWGIHSIKIKKIQILPQCSYYSAPEYSQLDRIIILNEIIRQTNKNFPMLLHYGKDNIDILEFLKNIYNMSFKWIRQFTESSCEKINKGQRQLTKRIMKFRIYYELLRDEFWDIIIIKYSLSHDIVYLIDSYL
jgi:hypothetical protein